jgi:ketosteroid isomerase-like protein
MSQENVEIVMAAYDAAQRQDGRLGLQLLDENVVWDMSGLGMPDLAKIYRGHDGILDFWGSWLAAWETIHFKTLDAEDHGDHVIVKVEQRNRGRASGVEVDFQYWQTFTVRGGTVTASSMAQTRPEALEAVGLRE